ncbi:MAG: hypothetical protein FVQ81_07805 [Candidatus Glassbacteria bacterium]|nr:hypothetical protein [Candidatus Glassbacteria bacterium]
MLSFLLFNKNGPLKPRTALVLLAAILLPAAAGPSPPGRTVAVVKSSDWAVYEFATRVISERLGSENDPVSLQQHTLEGVDQEERFWRELRQSNPSLVVTVGTQATRSAMLHSGNLPVVFTMVLDHIGQQPGDTKKDFAGVTLNIPVDRQLEYLKKALPGARRVGFIYSPGSEEVYESARRKAGSIGLQLVVEKVNSERDIPNTLRRMLPEIDVFWMPLDKLIFNYLVLSFVVTECFKNGVPIVSVYRIYAEAGIPITIGVDNEDIGRQTAELVLKRLGNGKFSKPLVEYPRKYLLFINEGVASRLNIEIPDELKSLTVQVKSGS